jgi:hypothetical protein
VGAWLLLVPVAGAQQPQEEGFAFDPIEVDSRDLGGVRCYKSPRHIVVERNRSGQVGTDLLVRSRQAETCEADSLPGDFVIRDEWAAYFSAIQGDLLLLDSGTGPDVRGLIIFDVVDRRRIAEISYVDLAPGPDSASIGVWDGAALDEPAPGCPSPPGGLLPGVDSLHYVNLRTGEARFAGQTRCAQRQ